MYTYESNNAQIEKTNSARERNFSQVLFGIVSYTQGNSLTFKMIIHTEAIYLTPYDRLIH